MLGMLQGKGRVLLLALALPVVLGFFGAKLTPEMKEVVDAFPDRVKLASVLQKYGEPGVVPSELTVCDMAKPVVAKAEEKNGIMYYTLESRVDACPHSPAAVGTVRIFALGWKNGKIKSFVWGGPKGGKVEY